VTTQETQAQIDEELRRRDKALALRRVTEAQRETWAAEGGLRAAVRLAESYGATEAEVDAARAATEG
jgi:hypothetical protein